MGRLNLWVVLAVALIPAPAGADAVFAPCAAPGLPDHAMCGTVAVPENPDDPAGRTIAVDVVRLPATEGPAADVPVVVLAGEPGDDVWHGARSLAATVAEANRRRDVVLVGARGTGSGALDCPLYPSVEAGFGALLPLDVLVACRDGLATSADLLRYTTEAAAGDVEIVRVALGAERIDLFARGAATRTAMTFAARHEDRVRTLTLQGAAPADFNGTAAFAEAAQQAFFQMFVRCARDGNCAKAFPDLKRDFAMTLARLAETPAETIVTEPEMGHQVTVTVDRDAFFTGLRRALDTPDGYARVPNAIAAAAEGDLGPAAGLIVEVRRAFDERSLGAHLAMVCDDDGPGLATAEPATSGLIGDIGDAWVLAYRDACAAWPHAGAERLPFAWSGPVLLLSGQVDPMAVPDRAEALLPDLEAARHVILNGPAHGTPEAEACVGSLLAAFLEAGTAADLETACAKATRLLDFVVPQR